MKVCVYDIGVYDNNALDTSILYLHTSMHIT